MATENISLVQNNPRVPLDEFDVVNKQHVPKQNVEQPRFRTLSQGELNRFHDTLDGRIFAEFLNGELDQRSSEAVLQDLMVLAQMGDNQATDMLAQCLDNVGYDDGKLIFLGGYLNHRLERVLPDRNVKPHDITPLEFSLVDCMVSDRSRLEQKSEDLKRDLRHLDFKRNLLKNEGMFNKVVTGRDTTWQDVDDQMKVLKSGERLSPDSSSLARLPSTKIDTILLPEPSRVVVSEVVPPEVGKVMVGLGGIELPSYPNKLAQLSQVPDNIWSSFGDEFSVDVKGPDVGSPIVSEHVIQLESEPVVGLDLTVNAPELQILHITQQGTVDLERFLLDDFDTLLANIIAVLQDPDVPGTRRLSVWNDLWQLQSHPHDAIADTAWRLMDGVPEDIREDMVNLAYIEEMSCQWYAEDLNRSQSYVDGPMTDMQTSDVDRPSGVGGMELTPEDIATNWYANMLLDFMDGGSADKERIIEVMIQYAYFDIDHLDASVRQLYRSLAQQFVNEIGNDPDEEVTGAFRSVCANLLADRLSGLRGTGLSDGDNRIMDQLPPLVVSNGVRGLEIAYDGLDQYLALSKIHDSFTLSRTEIAYLRSFRQSK